MSKLLLKLPDTLYDQLESLAQKEGVSLNQYIIFALTRQAILTYSVQAVTACEITQQRTDFSVLLQQLGMASFDEIEKILEDRDTVAPEAGLTKEILEQLQNRINW